MKRQNFTCWQRMFFPVALTLLGITMSNCRTVAQCLTAGFGQYPFGTVTVVCTGSPQNITTYGYAGEYSSVSIDSGTSYTFTSSNAADFITIGNESGTVVLASGATPITWTSTISGNVRFYTHTDTACGEEAVDRTRSISCAAPACLPPTAVSATSITQDGADIEWSGTGNFILEYGPAGFTPGTDATAGSGGIVIVPAISPVTLSGLSTSTDYSVYVRNNCTDSSAGFSTNAVSNFTTTGPPPANDECINAISLSGFVSGNNLFATESLIPSTCDGWLSTTAHDVWYSFVPETTGSIGIQVGQDSIDAIWEVYSGDCGNLTSMGCRDNAGELFANVNAGETYLLRVYGWFGDDGPFTITFTGVPLPVDGLELSGVLNAHAAELSWSTLSEVNNLGFEIQRSDNGIDFKDIGFVNSIAPEGNSFEKLQYSFSDRTMISGSVYYRLEQTDRDGKITISNIIRLSAKNDGSFSVLAAPNPTSNAMVIHTIGTQGNNSSINITDITGKVVYRTAATGNKTIIQMAGFSNGIYLIRYYDDLHNQVIKINKQ